MENNSAPGAEEVEEFYEPVDEDHPDIIKTTTVKVKENEEEVYDEVENDWEPEVAADVQHRKEESSAPSNDFMAAMEEPDTEVPEELAAHARSSTVHVTETFEESIAEDFQPPQRAASESLDFPVADDNVEIVEEVVIADPTGTPGIGDERPDFRTEPSEGTKSSRNPNIARIRELVDDTTDERSANRVASREAEIAMESRDIAPPSGSDKPAPAENKKKAHSLALAEHKRKALAAEQQMQLQAEQEQEAKANALKARAAKRLEEQEKREQRELLKQRKKAAAEKRAAAQGGGVVSGEGVGDEGAGVEDAAGHVSHGEGEPDGVTQGKPAHSRATGSHPNKIRSMVKNSKDNEGGAEGGGDWNDSIAAPVSASRKERHEAVERRRQERLEARARKLALAAGAADMSVAEGDTADEGSEALHPYPVKAAQLQGRSLNTKRRVRPQPTASSADSDADRLVLPPLVGAKQPRSSPNPARAALSSLLRDSEFPEPSDGAFAGSPSGKPRRSRKPLYLRMIEKAQAQYVEDERRKHESYVEQKKLKQKNNPTQEELRMHRRKHDELVQAKLEEGRRNLAEAAAANARALKRQQAVASAVQAALDEKGDGGELVVDGTSPLRKRQTKKKPVGAVVGGDSGAALNDMVPLPPVSSSKQRGEAGDGAEDFGFSPSKGTLGGDFSDSRHGSSEGRRNARASPPAIVSVTAGVHSVALDASPLSSQKRGGEFARDVAEQVETTATAILHVPLKFDAGAAAAAVQRIPALTSHAIPTYCASDWLDKLATADADLPASVGVSAGSSSAQVLLKPAPPHSDAQRLMNFAVP